MNLDTTLRRFEKRLVDSPNHTDIAVHLSILLDSYMPGKNGLGAYSDCQRKVDRMYRKARSQCDLLESVNAAQHYKRWQAILDSKNVRPQFPVPQLVMGTVPKIQGEDLFCGQYMALFKKEGVFPRVCLDCFKVQIIAQDLVALMQVYFILRDLKLPRDNARKCMVEFREGIPTPYKGYIYCESEDEARICIEAFQQIQRDVGLSNAKCGITHGCSEFGVKYPKFKFSNDGSHRSFERPESWDQSVTEFLSSVEMPKHDRTNYNKSFISIRDIFGLRTWINYAEIIGDMSYKMFLDAPSASIPEPFATRIKKQAKTRNAQLKELHKEFSSKAG